MASVRGKPWSKYELITVLKLYCKTPFGRIHTRNPEIKALAEALKRTPSSIALKMTNFASLDPTIARAGMGNYSRLDKEVWDEFFSDMDKYLSQDELSPDLPMAEPGYSLSNFPAGVDVVRLTKARVNQSFFRSMVLASYETRCALTGIDSPSLLIASHIVPWVANKEIRTNPRNGICLNSLHDSAFDCGLISFESDFSVIYSKKLSDVSRAALSSLAQIKLSLPKKFGPDPTYLDYHRKNRFLG